jgi:hypothetical protein
MLWQPDLNAHPRCDLRISEIFVSENPESCYSLRSTSDDEKPPWPCSARNPAAACRARRRRAEASNARGRLSQIAEAARPRSAVGRRTAARGLLGASILGVVGGKPPGRRMRGGEIFLSANP